MKKSILLALLLCLLAGAAGASTLYRIRFGYYPDKIRTVFDFDGGFDYHAEETREKITLYLRKTEASSGIQNYVELNDLIVRYLEVQREGEDLKVTVPLSEPVKYNIFYLNDPPRLVIDFDREFLNIVSGGTIAEGVEFLKVRQGTEAGRVNASVLKVDLKKARVAPALAQKHKPSIFESFIDLITPWRNPKEEKHFYLDKVSNIVSYNQGVAGINGTYFASTGKPLGALIIDREFVSFPIHERTAFFIDQENQPYIDNLFVSSYFRLPNGTRYQIAGINQGRGGNDIVMYTPVWGESTETDRQGIELVVADSRVTEINVNNSKIPENGFVISATGPALETLAESVKAGDQITTTIRIVPYAYSPKQIVHLISGGPRLLKQGRVYVSKHEEKFRADIAQGRAARTAVGITKQGELLLVTVDGLARNNTSRKKDDKASIGMALEELSDLMLSLGAVEAMNLDGGSSSTMAIEGRAVNDPAGGYERSVSNALVVKRRGP
jgi:hypothetical protein